MGERVVEIGTRRYTQVVCLDAPGAGNACHIYRVLSVQRDPSEPQAVYAQVDFQNWPVKESGVNGCQNEDLIAIVIDRLQGFQGGKFSCRENAIALTKLEEVLMWLRKGTDNRVARGVEGTHEK
jgi:hypothetical protein